MQHVSGIVILRFATRLLVLESVRPPDMDYKINCSLGCKFKGRNGNPNPNFLVRISSGGVGVFHVNGWGPKSSVCPSKPRKTKLLGGISQDFWRDVEKFEKNKVCVQCLAPKIGIGT